MSENFTSRGLRKQHKAMVAKGSRNRFCFLIGAGGTGKTSLMNAFVAASSDGVMTINEVARGVMKERCINQSDLSNHALFDNLQILIATKQLEEERKSGSSDSALIISDRSVIDALVYSLMRLPRGVASEEYLADRLCELVGSEEAAHEVLSRYQSSLMILLYPFDDNASINDNVRLLMSNAELQNFTRQCHRVLEHFGIPFIELREKSREGRLNLLQKAISEMEG
jgi:nicotinamide riboside kinase